VLRRMLPFVAALWLLAGATDASAQRREITGTVTSSVDGRPISGANVQLLGTSSGTLTNAAGRFTLTVPPAPARLRVMRIGYRMREVEVPSDQSAVSIALDQDVLNIEGVVVTGQATTVARRNLANAVATVSAQELVPVTAQTVESALQGKIVGANIQANSGAPGGGLQVNLRGVSSINAQSEPLWVIDGVVVSNVAIPSNQNAVTRAASGSNPSLNQDAQVNRIADLNPNDIERIEVLKGASAAAIYGSQASNGVILVTTKRGQGGAPQINVSQRLGYSELRNTIGSRQWTRAEAAGAFSGLTEAELDQYFDASGTPRQSFDLERQLAGRRSLASETLVSVTGGVADTRYYFSGLAQNEPGIISNTGYEKQSLRANLDQRLSSRVDVGVNANVMHSVARRGLTNNDNSGTSFYVALASTPNFLDLRRQPDGTYPINPFTNSNPLQTAALMTNDEDVWRYIAGGSANVDLLGPDVARHSLQLRANAGADYFTQRNDLFFPPELQFEQPDYDTDEFRGTSLLSNSSNLNLNGTANLIHTFSTGALVATTSAGLQYADNDLNIARIVGRNLIGGQRQVDAATNTQVRQQRQRVRTLGLYVQEELLLLDERMLLTGSVRADRSSANGDPDEYFFYPKASASYRLPGLARAVDELKLRVAYGESGNQPLFGQKFTPLSATNNIEGLPSLVISPSAIEAVVGDPTIRPERMREIEGGFDAIVLGGNATLEFTLYRQNITDLLLQRTVAPSSGFSFQFFNGGELRTEGVEAALSATPLRTPAFSWVTRTTFSTSRSKIVELPVPSFRTGGFATSLGAFQIEEGASATQIVGFNGRDADGAPIVDQLGDANPRFKMSFANGLTLGGVELYGLLDWQHRGTLINLTKLLYDLGQVSPDYALPASVAAPRSVPDCHPNCSGAERLAGFGTYTQQYLEDASFLKLRELTLSYTVPAAALGRVGPAIRGAGLSLSGRNLFSIDNYDGLDPEVSNFGSQQIARNIDVAPFPPRRTFWLSVNFTF
jgi:TonB-dependent starch-binding outer membrane protein SusC